LLFRDQTSRLRSRFQDGALQYYGLAIQRGSPFANTIVVGYADGLIGYLADPQAYKAGEYAAIVVPKILDFPPFTPTAATEMTTAAIDLLKQVAA